jgi:uncharacterized phage-associated protein
MSVIKLTYLAHGWYLAYFPGELVSDTPEAWQYGPIFPTLYHEFKRFGGGAIPPSAVADLPTIDADDDNARRLLDEVWRIYSKYSAMQLSTLTHRKDSPWHKTWDPAIRENPIPVGVIKEYYSKLRGGHDGS